MSIGVAAVIAISVVFFVVGFSWMVTMWEDDNRDDIL